MNLIERVFNKIKRVVSGEEPEQIDTKAVNEKKRFTCNWLFDSLVVLCDGRVVCGCADPHGKKLLGNIKDQNIRDIWNSDQVQKIRQGLNEGYTSFCEGCILKCYLEEDASIEQRPEIVESIPRLFVEPTIVCNLSCYDAICGFNSDIVSTRTKKRISMDEFRKVVDQVGDMVERLHLFNYGEPFVHPEAVDMVEYAKSNYPHIHVFTSTNGVMLNEEKIERLVKAGMDEIALSIDGCDQKSYIKYRIGGDFDKAIKVLEIFQQKKRELGLDRPFINWRYILFKWNHSRRQMNKAVKMAEKLGIERLTWEITDHPEEAKSEKYQVGTDAWKKIAHETWEMGDICNAIKSKKYLADIKLPAPYYKMGVNKLNVINVVVKNSSMISWPIVNGDSKGKVYLGAHLCDANKEVVELHYALAVINNDPQPGESVNINIVLPPVKEVGKYYLQFDITAEELGWFKFGGSKTPWMELEIVESVQLKGDSAISFIADIDLRLEELDLKAGIEGKIEVNLENRGTFMWQHVSNYDTGWARLGAQLHDENKKMINLDYSRAFINKDFAKGDRGVVEVELPAIEEAGTYFLKFDMVIEGVMWLETADSPVKWLKLNVK